MIEFPHNLYLLFVKASVCDSVEEEQPERCGFYTFVADGSCAPEWYRPRSAVYDIDQTQVGQEHASALKRTSKLNAT